LSQLYCPEQDCVSQTRDVADVLVETGKITPAQLSELRQTQKNRPGCDVYQLIKELKLVEELDISVAQADLYDLKFRRVEPDQVDRNVFGKLDLDYIRSRVWQARS